MTKTFFTLIGLAGLALILMSNDTGVATEAGKDRTGSPFNATGGAQCNACHSGASFSTSITTRLEDSLGNVVTEYYANHTYKYIVDVTSTGASKYGFQAIALLTAGNLNAGNLTAVSSNAKIKVLASTRRYAEHTAPSTSGTFVMDWKAPVFGSGSVNFYAAGNGVNADALKTGDKPSSPTVLTITENTLAGVNEISSSTISVYPNPVSNVLNIVPNFNGNGNIIIASVSGKIVSVNSVVFSANNKHSFDFSNLQNGNYVVTLIDQNGVQKAQSTFIKQ